MLKIEVVGSVFYQNRSNRFYFLPKIEVVTSKIAKKIEVNLLLFLGLIAGVYFYFAMRIIRFNEL